MKAKSVRPTRPRRPLIPPRRIHLLPMVGILPSFILATWALSQPWARGRFLLVWGIQKSPEAVALVVMAVVAMVVSSVTVALRARRLRTAAILHLFTGAGMLVVTWLAWDLVRRSSLKLLGFLTLASVRPALGFHLFLLASALVTLLGGLEMAVAWRRAHRRRVVAPAEAGPASPPA